MTAPFLEISDAFSDLALPADFPKTIQRFRNDRWAGAIGLRYLGEIDWLTHFGRFKPLPDNLPQPLAMRYHGHQFGQYNPDIGDGRGFLFAQIKAGDGRWLDLGTKGSGQTLWSRMGDGRLTLKGGVREVLASTYLEALGVNTSKIISLIETGEQLERGDEPSPARSSVMVRLVHSHIRFGTFQRVAYENNSEAMARLVDHCIAHYHPIADGPETSAKTTALLEQITIATARMIGQWMAAGFVHGVMNTDNFNITGETFDFGPYRFLPTSDPNFTAAYFDYQGLYRFGRQPGQGLWALQQLASAMRLLAEAAPLTDALRAYEPAYQRSFADHTLRLLGLKSGALKDDLEFISLFYTWMTETEAAWPQVFFDWLGGAVSTKRALSGPLAELYEEDTFTPVRSALEARDPDRPERLEAGYFQRSEPASLLIDEIEALWARIADEDDWSAFEGKLAELELARLAQL